MNDNSPSVRWNETGWQDKERFLIQHGYKTGWSSHTWKYLDEKIRMSWAHEISKRK